MFSPSQEEHEAILKNRQKADSGLTWQEYKSMTYTFQVLQSVSLVLNFFDILL